MRYYYFLLIGLIISSTEDFAQSKFFTGSHGEYSVLLNEKVTSQHRQNEKIGYTDYYVLRENDSFVYMVSITNAGPIADANSIYTESFRVNFLKSCGCESLQSKKTSFNNFIGNAFVITTTLNDAAVKGYSVAVVRDKILYSVNFFTLAEQFQSLDQDSKNILNSLVFQK
jgi:hypothetical protein